MYKTLNIIIWPVIRKEWDIKSIIVEKTIYYIIYVKVQYQLGFKFIGI
jgi:hypothetical protein